MPAALVQLEVAAAGRRGLPDCAIENYSQIQAKNAGEENILKNRIISLSYGYVNTRADLLRRFGGGGIGYELRIAGARRGTDRGSDRRGAASGQPFGCPMGMLSVLGWAASWNNRTVTVRASAIVSSATGLPLL